MHRGNYDIRKVFVDGSDICSLYDFISPKVTTFLGSWYPVTNGRISSIQTVFDPRDLTLSSDQVLHSKFG